MRRENGSRGNGSTGRGCFVILPIPYDTRFFRASFSIPLDKLREWANVYNTPYKARRIGTLVVPQTYKTGRLSAMGLTVRVRVLQCKW